MEKAVDGVGEFVTKNKRPVTFSFRGFSLQELSDSMAGLQEGQYATLSAHEFDDDAMLRSLVVGVSKDMRQVVLDLELQRTAMGVQLNPQFPQVFLRETFVPFLEGRMEQLKEELQEEASVRVAVEDDRFNIIVQGDTEGKVGRIVRVIGQPGNKSYTQHYLDFHFVIDGDVSDMEQLLMTIFESIGDLISMLQETSLDISKKMPNIAIPVVS